MLRYVLLTVALVGLVCHAEESPAMHAGHPNLPDGYEMVAYLNCGAEQECVGAGGVRIRQDSGSTIDLQSVNGPLGIAVQDGLFLVEGMDEDGDYVLGFTFWNVDAPATTQKFQVQGLDVSTLVPPMLWGIQASAYHAGQPTWTRVLAPLEEFPHFRGSGMRIHLEGESPGAPSVVNELFLLKRKSEEMRKRILIVTGDDYEGHLWRETGPAFAEILRADPRLEVSISESPAVLGASFMKHYDAVLLHFKDYADRLPLGERVRAGLDRFVSEGGGLIVAHFGCGAFQEWDGFVRVAGRVWDPALRPHDPYGPFDVRITDDGHPVTQGMEDFTTEDELYTCLVGETPVQVLCEATSKVDEQPYPMGFVLRVGEGRVFHCPLGHDVNALKSEGARKLYRRATAWAVGLEP